MIDKKAVWAIIDPRDERVYVARNFSVNTTEDDRTITIEGDLVWIYVDQYKIHGQLQVQELRIRKAFPSELKAFADAEAELRLKAVLKAGGIVLESVLEKGIPEEVKKILQQAPELATHVQTVPSELLTTSWNTNSLISPPIYIGLSVLLVGSWSYTAFNQSS